MTGESSRTDRAASDELAPGLRTYWDQARGRLRTLRVEGQSMAPTLRPGDLLYADPVLPAGGLPVGALGLFEHPFRRLTLVKRVEARTPSGRYRVRGDHPDATESQDSRGFGKLAACAGRIVLLRRGLGDLADGAVEALLSAAPEALARRVEDGALRLAGALDSSGCEAHLELARGQHGHWLTLSVGALPWLQEPWFRAWEAQAAAG